MNKSGKQYKRKDWHKSDKKHRLGVLGEDLTAKYIQTKLGMRLIERNARFRMGELDIVAIDKNRICFIEVKTRSSTKHGRPSLALTPEKQRTIRFLAESYLKYHKEFSSFVPRLDVAEVIIIEDKAKINYIKSAF